MGRFILVTGGARSGKSTFAEQLAENYGHVCYLATAEPRDGEMQERILRHQARRNPAWKTIECPLDPADALKKEGSDAYLLDCITLWISNLLLLDWQEDDSLSSKREERVMGAVDVLLDTVARAEGDVIAVSNEVGLGLVPETPLGRLFRDVAGRVNQRLAAFADEVYVLFSGIPLKIK